MFPQAHGDVYGHYLTALTGYCKLLTNPFFDWVPKAETLSVLGQTVEVDYKDERKFAIAAAALARRRRCTRLRFIRIPWSRFSSVISGRLSGEEAFK